MAKWGNNVMQNSNRRKILIDSQAAVMQEYGGISRYTSIIARGIENDNDVYMPCRFLRSRYFEGFQGKKCVSVKNRNLVYAIKIINSIHTCIFCATHKIDLYHPSYYYPFALLFITKKTKVVVTIHDLIFELFPELFSKHNMIPWGRKLILKRADKIIAVSENTKRDLLKVYPWIDANKIEVIYEGGLITKEEKKFERVKIPDRYVLYIGEKSYYKNFNTFFEAMKQIMKVDHELYAVCVGGKKADVGEWTDHVIQINCSDTELNYLYRHAKCFVYPSKYEGFGIPVLESMENGCPAILADTKVFREIAGDAALFFSVEDGSDSVKALSECISRCVEDDVFRKKMIEKGKERAAVFSWDKMVKQINGLYLDVMNE